MDEHKNKNPLYNFNHLFNNFPIFFPLSHWAHVVCCVCAVVLIFEMCRLKQSVDIDCFSADNHKFSVNKPNDENPSFETEPKQQGMKGVIEPAIFQRDCILIYATHIFINSLLMHVHFIELSLYCQF